MSENDKEEVIERKAINNGEGVMNAAVRWDVYKNGSASHILHLIHACNLPSVKPSPNEIVDAIQHVRTSGQTYGMKRHVCVCLCSSVRAWVNLAVCAPCERQREREDEFENKTISIENTRYIFVSPIIHTNARTQ